MRKWLIWVAVAALSAGIIATGYIGAAGACQQPRGAATGPEVKALLDDFLQRSMAARAETGVEEIVYLGEEQLLTQVFSPDATLPVQAAVLDAAADTVKELPKPDDMALPLFARTVLSAGSASASRNDLGFYSLELPTTEGTTTLTSFVINDCLVEVITSEGDGISIALNYGLDEADFALLRRAQG